MFPNIYIRCYVNVNILFLFLIRLPFKEMSVNQQIKNKRLKDDKNGV